MTLYEPTWFLKLAELQLSHPSSTKSVTAMEKTLEMLQYWCQISGAEMHMGKKNPQEYRSP